MPLSDRHSARDFSLWLLLSTTVQFANPFGTFGWPELLASTGPLVLGLDRRIRPVPTALLGAGLIAALALLSRERILDVWTFVPPLCFAVGVAFAARAFDSQAPSGRLRGSWAALDPTPAAREAFAGRCERELGRARRYDKLLVLLSVAPASAVDRTAVEPRRALPAIGRLLSRELRVYADGMVDDGRVLALVPEVERDGFDAFVKRVRTALEQGLDFAVQIGVAVFPDDSIDIEGLVETADLDREQDGVMNFPAHLSASDPAFEAPREPRRVEPS